MFRRTLVVALLALGLMIGTAQAGIIIAAQIVPDPTASNTPFLLENFGSGGTSGLVSSAAFITSSGVGVSFTGGSGVFVGDVTGVTRSPFRTGAVGDPADIQHYLSAQAFANSSVVLAYTSAQTAFNLLWGSVDPSPATYNQLTFTFSSGGGSPQVVTGAEVVALVSGVTAGTTNLAVSISGLDPFNTITVTASQQAFEFVPAAVPDGGTTLMLLGGALVGLGALRRKFRL
jgi:hypothetical protein